MNSAKPPTSKVAIVDYGTGNLNSIKRILDRIGIDGVATSAPEDIRRAEKLILPGVGHFGAAMGTLNRFGLVDVLNEAVLEKQIPVLGICLGMELMARKSEEGNVDGLGWLDAENVRLEIGIRSRHKVPHMGWNRIVIKKESPLMEDVEADAEFYFAHSYHLRLADASDVLCETEYAISFPSAISRGNIFGVQFHPEKSHDAGARLLKNFVEL